jgi:hypothetical protein
MPVAKVRGATVAVLRLNTDGVTEAARQAAGAPPAGVPAAAITAAADPVSVTVAHAVGTQIAIIGAGTGLARALAQVASARLNANAGEYGAQEHFNAATLGTGGDPAAVPGEYAPAPPSSLAAPSFPVPQSATAPTSAKHIAQLIHWGPGPEPLRAAASRLRAHAEELRGASVALRGATEVLEGSWWSDAGAAAHGRISELADFYERHAQTAAAAAQQAEAQGDNVSRVRAAIPRPDDFEEVESRLRAAVRANAKSKGAYSAVVAALQAQHGELTAKTTAGFTDYALGSATALDDAALSPPPDDVIVGGDGHHDPTVRMAGFGQGPAPLSPNTEGPLPPAPGAQPQIGPFPVPPQVAAAAQPPAANPGSALDQMLLGNGPASTPGANPLDPLLQQLVAPTPPGPMTPDQIQKLVSEAVQRQLTDAQRFSILELLDKAAKGCVLGGATAGVATLFVPPSEVVSIPAGCATGLVGGAGDYLWDQATK